MSKSKFHTLLREPLLHFLVIGVLIFFLFNQVGSPKIETSQRITITKANLDLLAATWLKSTGKPPSAQEIERQLDYYIREQVLYREAMAMGLDQDDAIVRRRLAKKMEYLFNDLSFVPEPTESELASFLSEQASKFAQPAHITFTQVFFNPIHRGQEIKKDAEQLLKQLKETIDEVETIDLGDRSLLPYNFTNERKNEITSMFGLDFSKQVFALPIGSWQGPINSEYGVHLVYIDSRSEDQLPPLAEIREHVVSEWRITRRNQANEIFYKSLLQRYQIVLDNDVKKDARLNARQ